MPALKRDGTTLFLSRSCTSPGSAGRTHRVRRSRRSDARRRSGAGPCRPPQPAPLPYRPAALPPPRRSARLVASSNAGYAPLGSVLTAKLRPRFIREALRSAAKPRLSRFPSRAPRAHRAQPSPSPQPSQPAAPHSAARALRPAQLLPPPCPRPARGPRPSRPRPAAPRLAAPQTMGAGRYSPNKVRAMAQAGAGRPQRGRHWRGGASRRRQGAPATPAELPAATDGKGMRAARGRLGRARPRSRSSRPPCRPPALSVRPAASGSHLAPPHDPPPALLPQPAGPFPWQRGRPAAAEAQRSAGAGRQVRSPGHRGPEGRPDDPRPPPAVRQRAPPGPRAPRGAPPGQSAALRAA